MSGKDVLLSRQEIVPGETETLREWFAGEAENKDQVRDALRDEGVHVESVFIHTTDEGATLLYYIEADDFDEAIAAFLASEHENIQQYQEVVEQTLVGGLEGYHRDRADVLFHAVVDPDRRRPASAKDVLLRVDPVNEDHLADLHDVYDEIASRPEEAHEALDAEDVIAESAFLKDVDGETTMYLYVESADWERTQQLYAESDRELDVEHRETMADALAKDGSEIEPVFHVVAEPDG